MYKVTHFTPLGESTHAFFFLSSARRYASNPRSTSLCVITRRGEYIDSYLG